MDAERRSGLLSGRKAGHILDCLKAVMVYITALFSVWMVWINMKACIPLQYKARKIGTEITRILHIKLSFLTQIQDLFRTRNQMISRTIIRTISHSSKRSLLLSPACMRTCLGRTPDKAGLESWVNVLESGR